MAPKKRTAQKKTVLVIHGPNLNLLGTREPDLYGANTLTEIDAQLKKLARELGLDINSMQSNSEAEIIEKIQAGDFALLIINPAAYTHTSVAIRDAISAVAKPVIEVHLSNIHKREEFRKHSYISGVALGQISGFGPESYYLALRAAAKILGEKPAR
jgi:3-dehydroquinate dehydratase-2